MDTAGHTTAPRPAPGPEAHSRRPRWRTWQRLSLRSRTFLTLLLLILCNNLIWVYSLRALVLEPRAVLSAGQIATMAHISQEALQHTSPVGRAALLQAIEGNKELRLQKRLPTDRAEPLSVSDAYSPEIVRILHKKLVEQLGPETEVVQRVNGQNGLWVGFELYGTPYWLGLDHTQLHPSGSELWMVWLLSGGGLALLGALVIAHWLYRPLGTLATATQRVRSGNLDQVHLDEHASSREINELHASFNEMVQRLSRIESERTVMLAGISHDLRTPLSRLRLEMEMSVPDPVARGHMAADIEQLDATIDKFMDYARPDRLKLDPVRVQAVVQACALAVQNHHELKIQTRIPADLFALGDEVDLSRVVANLIENARRYGQSADSGVTLVEIQAHAADGQVVLEVRDHGQGVSAEHLGRLTEPFFRSNTARTGAAGAGLGLAIVRKTVRRMQGDLVLGNAPGGGFLAQVRLQQATDVPADLAARLQRPAVPRQQPRRRASDRLVDGSAADRRQPGDRRSQELGGPPPDAPGATAPERRTHADRRGPEDRRTPPASEAGPAGHG